MRSEKSLLIFVYFLEFTIWVLPYMAVIPYIKVEEKMLDCTQGAVLE